MEYQYRNLSGFLKETLAARPLVYLTGPRQTGKSTLVQRLETGGAVNYMTLDSPLLLAGSKADPAAFVKSFREDALNIIDEVQLSPELFPYLKMAVDEQRLLGLSGEKSSSCRFLLTGSSNIMALPALSGALAGRMSVLTLLPFSAAEYMRTNRNFIDALWTEELRLQKLVNHDFLDCVTNATFPEIACDPAINRTQWFDDYLLAILQRDVRNIADIRNPDKMIMLLSLFALRAGGILNNSQVSSEAGLDNKTYDRYKGVLKNTYLVFELPAWDKPNRLNKRFTKSPKLYFNDTNLLVYLMRRDIMEIYRNKEPLMGHLFENFIATEIMKNAAALTGLEISYFRTQDQIEVDFVVEKTNGDTLGVEVKLSSTVNAKDFTGLKLLEKAAGNRFKKGVVFYTGNEITPFGENLWALPVSYLWNGESSANPPAGATL